MTADESFSESLHSVSDESFSADFEDGIEGIGTTIIEGCSEPSWEVITPNNIGAYQTNAVTEIAELLASSYSSARTLLIGYRWDKEAIMNDFGDKGKEAVFRQAGCILRAEPPRSISGMVFCECCLNSVEFKDCKDMNCGHYFCNECWLQHFRVQITEGKSCKLQCMGFQCNVICEETKALELLQHTPNLRKKYEKALVDSYVNDNINVKWCPSTPSCGNAIKVNGEIYCEPQCICGKKFCFSCLEEAHSPCTCDMWSAWERKRMDDSETKNWITANTKPCPSCGKAVEKNGGCNLMTCRCGQYFCWLCGDKTGFRHTYSSITNHQCGRWKEQMDKDISTAAAVHKRYMHYFARWKQHCDSFTKDEQNREAIEESLDRLYHSSENIFQKWSSLRSMVDILLTARKVVANSYPFAFFMCGRNWFASYITDNQNAINQTLFEDLQQQFENEVENLSRLLSSIMENGDNTEDEATCREMILNSSRSIVKRMGNFYHAINTNLLAQIDDSACYIASFVPRDFQL